MDQVEVDCVINCGNTVWGNDVKAAQTVDGADTKSLRRLAGKAGKDFAGGIVPYSGTSAFPLGGTPFLAVPFPRFREM